MSDATRRSITDVVRDAPVIDDDEMRLYRVLPGVGTTALGPFVFFDHYRHVGLRGIGDQPHPHAGIEVVSYLLDGAVEHRDSLGSRDRLQAGDAQWIGAGRGIVHAEQPLSGRHGLQLWTSLPAERKFDEPAYRSWRAADIPESTSPAGRVRVVAGTVAAMTGPMGLARPTTLAVIHLAAGASIEVAVAPHEELGLYVADGAIDGPGDTSIDVGGLATLSLGSSIVVSSVAGRSADVVVFGGAEIFEPILFSGPFVMDSREHLDRARRDYAAGRMGYLA